METFDEEDKRGDGCSSETRSDENHVTRREINENFSVFSCISYEIVFTLGLL
jgi:hypothetical protein